MDVTNGRTMRPASPYMYHRSDPGRSKFVVHRVIYGDSCPNTKYGTNLIVVIYHIHSFVSHLHNRCSVEKWIWVVQFLNIPLI